MKNRFLTPRWIITTFLVILAVAGMVLLGFWQLDRLEQRRAFNARVSAQVDAPALDLNQAPAPEALLEMEYRAVTVRGAYDANHEIIVRNQASGSLPGYHLLTPLIIAGTDQAVLVNRGFIPLEDALPAARARYAQPGPVTVRGILRQPHVPRFAGVPDPTLAPGQTRLDAWNHINLARIQSQLPYEILPVYIESAAGAHGSDADADASASVAAAPAYPIPVTSRPDLSEGSHLGYAAQWFTFAAILALGYPFFVRSQLRRAPHTRARKHSISTGESEA